MSRISALRERIERLDTLLAHNDPDEAPGGALMRRGLSEMRDSLHGDLSEARKARLDIVMSGVPVLGHEMRVDALAKLLHSVQESVSSIAQALTGRATSRASLPGPLRDQTALRLALVYPGSFGAVLHGPEGYPTESPTLFDDDELPPTLLDQALDVVLSIMDLANTDDLNDDPIIERVLPLGSRAFKHLSDLSSAVVDEDMSATFSFSSPSSPSHLATLDTRSARRLSDVLGRNRLTEGQEQVVGRLGTASDIRNRIELQTADGIISAKVIDEIVPQLAQFFTKRVLATFETTTLRSQISGQERTSYVLVGLAEVADPGTDHF